MAEENKGAPKSATEKLIEKYPRIANRPPRDAVNHISKMRASGLINEEAMKFFLARFIGEQYPRTSKGEPQDEKALGDKPKPVYVAKIEISEDAVWALEEYLVDAIEQSFISARIKMAEAIVTHQANQDDPLVISGPHTPLQL